MKGKPVVLEEGETLPTYSRFCRCDKLKGSLLSVLLGMTLSDEPLSTSTLATMWSIHLMNTCRALLCPFDRDLLLGEGEVVISRVIFYDPFEAFHRDILGPVLFETHEQF